jgi:hypothetical protein
MTEWWQKPYPTGRAVPVAGFPRPLYPPDSPGHTASQPGQDVMAYKRAISRGGRWPWTPEEWDYEFSKNFSHGKEGGHVEDSGIAGFQRQMGITDSGFVGEETFNKLRIARVPPDLPNAGYPLFDVLALNLIGLAWKEFQGKEPEPPVPPTIVKPTLRVLALKKAITQIGVRESPFASNRQKYGEWYRMNGVPWCAIFVSYCIETSGNSPSFTRGDRYSFVPNIVYDAGMRRNGLSLTLSPIPGDLVCYDWYGGGADHVGFFERGTRSSFTAIEGNTSSINWSNGGAVLRQPRSASRAYRMWFVRVDEPD